MKRIELCTLKGKLWDSVMGLHGQTGLGIICVKSKILNQCFLVSSPSFNFCRLSTGLYGTLCNVYCVQCNIGKVFFFDYPDYQSPDQI